MLLAEKRFPDTLGHAHVVRLSGLGQFGVHLAIARWYAVVGGALEHGELFSLLRNFRNGLDRRGAGADYAHALVGEVNAGVREAAGVVPLALEFLQALELRYVRGRQTTYCGNEVRCRNLFPVVGTHRPQVGSLVEFGAGHARIELNVAFEIVAFGNMLEITEDFVLLGIALGPFPLLQELFVPSETVNVGVGIATRAGVAVPVPGAAYGFTTFIDSHLQTQFVPQRLQHVQAGKTCVKVLSCASHLSLLFCCLHRRQRNSIRRSSEEPRSYAALCAASSKPQTPLSGAANVCRHLLSAHGQHLHQNDT